VQEAQRRGIPLSNDTQIFMEQAPCPTVGITGSAGKTTTTTLVGMMAHKSLAESHATPSEQLPVGVEAGHGRGASRAVFVGGNIGDPLLNHLGDMRPDDVAILEISSFQLEQMTLSPHVAVILNITPNHLDRHGTMEAYTAAKARILQFQGPGDFAVLSRDDPGAWHLRGQSKGRLLAFSLKTLEHGLDGAYLNDDMLNLRIGNAYLPLLPREHLRLRGDHNVSNALAAFAIGHAIGLPLDAMLETAAEFEGVPHRLEFVRELHGAHWYNDSIATTPERTMAAIRSFAQPLVLLLGGRDKDLPWEELAALVCQRVDHLIVFGEAQGKILAAVHAAGTGSGRPLSIKKCDTLEAAVLTAAGLARPGQVVLLSPGGTSYDAFLDFEQRGERFRQCAHSLS
jgi:UDP-N-acetylmuramoylalanine--D-glutamate ligase